MEERSSPLLRLIVEIKNSLHELVKAVSAYQTTNGSKEEEKANTELKAVVSLPEEVTEYYKSENSERGKSNRREQIRTILECIGVGAAIILAILTLCTLRTYNGQLIEARRANNDLEKQFQAQQRAWVGNGVIKVKRTALLLYPDNPIQGRTQVDLLVDVPLKNVGNSPAFNVQTWMTPIVTEQIGADQSIETMMEYACGGSDRNAKSVGQVLFPNSPETTVEWPMSTGTPFTQINQVHRIWIDICITYSSTAPDKRVHHTKIWMASWPVNGKPTEIRRTTQPRIIYYSLPIPGWVVVKTEAD